MTYEDFKKLQISIPDNPGVYKFIDPEGTILYVGKAKNIRKRVSNYFGNRKNKSNKIRTLVKNADRLEFIVVETEQDALLLENTLIKNFQPRYNVSLKDAKSYSYLVIRNERFPRVYITRTVYKDGSTYYGPYTSKARLKIVLELIKNLFPLRNCSFDLSESNISKKKFKVCLEYHIKNCEGPCEGLEETEAYDRKIAQIRNILKGNFGLVKSHFKEEMNYYVEAMEFEKAQQIKEKLSVFEDYQYKSTVVNKSIKDIDVFTYSIANNEAFVHYLKVVNGAIINTHTAEFVLNLEDNAERILDFAIPIIREKFNSIANEILVPHVVNLPTDEMNIQVPKKGDKKKLIELSQKNLEYFLIQKRKQDLNKIRKQTSAERILTTLKEDLMMERLPMHLECFDNSNLGGSYPVASCVVFKNAKPSKKDYRHFHIKTVEGANDFASMEEVVKRRYSRLVDEDQPLPDLIIIDGGKGQLSSAVKILNDLGLEGKITVIGIAKKLEEIFFPHDPIPLYINKKSESLKLIQQARNEAHRFAIEFHRNMRSKNFTVTGLTDISGIGSKTAEKLLKSFKSVKKIKAASFSEIEGIVGKSAAQKVFQHFQPDNE